MATTMIYAPDGLALGAAGVSSGRKAVKGADALKGTVTDSHGRAGAVATLTSTVSWRPVAGRGASAA